MTHNEARLPAGHAAALTTVRTNPVPAYPNDPGAKMSTVAWAIVSSRGRARSHVERLKQLEAAGLVMNEVSFQRIAGQIP